MQPRCDYVLVGRRVALSRDFRAMGEELEGALKRLDTQLSKRGGFRQAKRAATDGTS